MRNKDILMKANLNVDRNMEGDFKRLRNKNTEVCMF